jgi:hypothetical protein
MARERKLKEPVTLFAAVESAQHERLRAIAFEERRSIADIVREAIDRLVENRNQTRAASTRRVI